MVVMSTFFSDQSDASAVNDLRAWSEKQLIAAAKSGRRAPFGELCERHMKQVSCVTRIAINASLMKLRKNRGAREVPIDEPNPSSEPVAQREFRYDAPDPEESCSLRERKR